MIKVKFQDGDALSLSNFSFTLGRDPFPKDLDKVTSVTKVTFEPKLQSGRHRLSQESQGPGWECAVDQSLLFLYHCIHTKYDFFLPFWPALVKYWSARKEYSFLPLLWGKSQLTYASGACRPLESLWT